MTEHLCVDCGCDISDKHCLRLRCDACLERWEKKRHRIKYQKTKGKTGLSIKAYSYAGKCQSCAYWSNAGFCDFYYQTGRTRTSLHPPGEKLNDPCKEYTPRGGNEKCKNSPFASDSIVL